MYDLRSAKKRKTVSDAGVAAAARVNEEEERIVNELDRFDRRWKGAKNKRIDRRNVEIMRKFMELHEGVINTMKEVDKRKAMYMLDNMDGDKLSLFRDHHHDVFKKIVRFQEERNGVVLSLIHISEPTRPY